MKYKGDAISSPVDKTDKQSSQKNVIGGELSGAFDGSIIKHTNNY